jgi:chromosome segregation ATPase
MVVNYVANADNYRQKSDSLQTRLNSAVENQRSAKKDLADRKKQYQRQEDNLNNRIATLTAELTKLSNKLNDVEREKAVLLEKVNSWASITKDFYSTNDKQGQLLQNTLNELKKAQAAKIKQAKELNETTNRLIEKMAVIETLEADKRGLLEAKAELQGRLDKYLQAVGQVATRPVPVTPERSRVRQVTPETRDIGLKGLVKQVDLKNSMARVSLGAADGVKKNMIFHVTRGNEFICDIEIIDVDAEEAIGVLKLIQQPPRVNDSISTNF